VRQNACDELTLDKREPSSAEVQCLLANEDDCTVGSGLTATVSTYDVQLLVDEDAKNITWPEQIAVLSRCIPESGWLQSISVLSKERHPTMTRDQSTKLNC